MEDIKRIKGVFNAPPKDFPSRLTTGAAVIGNGDLLVAVGGPSSSLAFRLSKLDFWQAREEATDRAGARAVGTLTLNIPELDNSSYLLEQTIHDATIRGRFEKGETSLSVTAWTPRGLNALVLELQATGRKAVTLQPVFEIQGGNESTVESGSLGEIAWYERRFEQPNLLWKTGVAVAMRAADGMSLTLEPGQKQTLVLAVVTNHDTSDYRLAAVKMAQSLDDTGLGKVRSLHMDWWRALWEKCSEIDVGDTYLENCYYGSHYIIASCSGNRNFPPGLFAWITDDSPCWGGDYHANYNFEAPWWGVLTSNLVELSEPYDQAIMDYLPRMKAYAKRFLGVRGAYCNVGFGPKGLHANLAESPHDDGLNFLGQKSNAAFLAVNMIMRYYLTLDLDYARQYAYPYLVEVMNFWEDYLIFEDGRYVTQNDCVNECEFYMVLPEGHRDFERARDKNPPLSLGLIRMSARAVIDISIALGVDDCRRGKWQHILDHISEFPLTERSGKILFDVCENGLTRLEDVNMCCIQHVYPANAVSLSSDTSLVRAAVDTIIYKDLWECLNAFSTIFAASARVNVDPVLILEKMKLVTKKYIQPNFLFQMGGGGIENSSGIPDGINEMLLQSHEGFLRLFPCWPNGRPAAFQGIRAYGAFLVSSVFNGDEVEHVTVTSEKGKRCRILNAWKNRKVTCSADGALVPITDGVLLEFDTKPGKTYHISHAPCNPLW